MATVHVGANADPHTEHHSGLLHLKVGLFRLNAVGHPRRPTCSLIAPDDYAWRSHPSATERIRARDDASEQREVGAAGELGLAVDVAQNAADAYPNIPSDNAVVSRA